MQFPSKPKMIPVNCDSNTTEDNNDDYRVVNYEEEYDPDQLEEHEDDDETSAHLLKAFGSTMNSDCQDETTSNSEGRSIRTQGALDRLQKLEDYYNLSMIAILEPKTNKHQLNYYKISLGWTMLLPIPTVRSGYFGTKMLTVKFWIKMNSRSYEKRPWDKMLQFSRSDKPWFTIGDFNVINDIDEKMRGLPYNMNKNFEFISVIEACGLTDLGFHGQKFTWCNHKDGEARIWKRLDRAIVNDKWIEVMPMSNITHLPSTGSDHCPLLPESVDINTNTSKYFKFLYFWVDNPKFLDIVKACWERPDEGEDKLINEEVLRCIPSMITEYQNQKLQAMPTKEELKQAIWSMSANSAAVPDGMSGMFFHSSWDIISDDLFNMIQLFFCGHSIPKFISHACLVLLPKVNHPNKFSKFRPIFHSNFTDKMYETTSGQLINKEKNQLLIPEKLPPDIIERTKAITGFSHTFGPITYLGCPTTTTLKQIRMEVEPHIQWAINSGSCSFWWDDWLGVGSLANHSDYLPSLNNVTVSSYLVNGEWNEDKIRQCAPQQLIHKILHTNVRVQQDIPDQAI
ncbi:hypothetical protein MTR67_040355 [Solanum verrucosum]|uniref:Uncharacterized protein n=1 Tax=Solanum verrucosum TaxID=315347 RepID=A0AAF0ZRL2_SOLVR|nr:hypothetical protein MTR67_040355 [Solanum verrucosum]